MIYAIGDIHGKSDMLLAALTEIRLILETRDTVVFLGDYIDRGPDSRGVIEAAIEFQQEHENVVFLRGNHEQMFIDAAEGDAEDWWENGGKQTLASYKGADISPLHISFLESTEMEWISERFHFVHAGLVPPSRRADWGKARSAYLVPPEPRLWIRNDFIHSHEDFGKIVVFGHTPQLTPPLPLIMSNKLGIDTGAFFGGRLTVVALSDDAGDFHAGATQEHYYFQIDQALSCEGWKTFTF